MKSPQKGGTYELEGYGSVLVYRGPSPEIPLVYFKHGPIDDYSLGSIHIDEFKERRIR